MAPKYKLTYFPCRALGEPIRFLLSYLEEDFEDFRFNRPDWPSIKPTTPWGKCPVLEIEGKPITQATSICRYLGREAGLNGKNSWEDLRIDEIVSVVEELRLELLKYKFEPDEKIKAAMKDQVLTETVPFYLKKLDAHIKQNNGFMANGKLSWADLYFAAIIDFLSYMSGFDLTASYPNTRVVRDKVFALPQIKAWLDKRIKEEF